MNSTLKFQNFQKIFNISAKPRPNQLKMYMRIQCSLALAFQQKKCSSNIENEKHNFLTFFLKKNFKTMPFREFEFFFNFFFNFIIFKRQKLI